MPSIVWKGHLTFGLVSIPVKLFRAARRERVSLHYVHRPEAAEPPVMAPMSGRGAEPAKSESVFSVGLRSVIAAAYFLEEIGPGNRRKGPAQGRGGTACSEAVALRHPVMPVANGLGSGFVGIDGHQL